MPRMHNEKLIKVFSAEVALSKGLLVIAGTADGQVKLPAAAGDKTLGAVKYTVAINEDVEIIMEGIAILIASAAITRDAEVRIAGTSGKIAAYTPGVTTNTCHVGRALEAAAADGDEIAVWLQIGRSAV